MAKVHSVCTYTAPGHQTCPPDVLVTRQQPASKLKTLKWVSTDCKLNTHFRKPKMACSSWLPSKSQILIFAFLHLPQHIDKDSNHKRTLTDFYTITRTVYQPCLICLVTTTHHVPHHPKPILVPRGLQPLLLGPLNTCRWTLFNCHLVWVINRFLFLYVCFLDGSRFPLL